MSGIATAKGRIKNRIATRCIARSCAATLAILALLASPSAWAAEKIRFGLNWLPEGEHCGFFQAKAAGLYEKAGLEVELKGGGPDVNVPSREQAEEFSRNEPFRKAGLFKSVKITRMRRGQWNPAAAPKTAEGN